jgi:hypothetical protein
MLQPLKISKEIKCRDLVANTKRLVHSQLGWFSSFRDQILSNVTSIPFIIYRELNEIAQNENLDSREPEYVKMEL